MQAGSIFQASANTIASFQTPSSAIGFDLSITCNNPITTGSAVWFDNGHAVAREDDSTACGAKITPPVSPEWESQ